MPEWHLGPWYVLRLVALGASALMATSVTALGAS